MESRFRPSVVPGTRAALDDDDGVASVSAAKARFSGDGASAATTVCDMPLAWMGVEVRGWIWATLTVGECSKFDTLGNGWCGRGCE